MVITFAFILSGAIGVGIIVIGLRFLLAPGVAAAGFGLPAAPIGAAGQAGQAGSPSSFLYAKGLRDIASGLFIFVLLAERSPHGLGAFLAAAAVIPLGDAVIVLRGGGSRAAAFGIHGVTALVILATSAALLSA